MQRVIVVIQNFREGSHLTNLIPKLRLVQTFTARADAATNDGEI
jgi:hypothetical protein